MEDIHIMLAPKLFIPNDLPEVHLFWTPRHTYRTNSDAKSFYASPVNVCKISRRGRQHSSRWSILSTTQPLVYETFRSWDISWVYHTPLTSDVFETQTHLQWNPADFPSKIIFFPSKIIRNGIQLIFEEKKPNSLHLNIKLVCWTSTERWLIHGYIE